MLLSGNTQATGQYFVMKYRTDHMSVGELWANTVENSHSNGKANKMLSYITDGEWHIIIADLSKEMPNYIKADEEGKYTIQWCRIDILNSHASEGYFDIAYIAICDDPADITSILQDGDAEFCPHFKAIDPAYEDTHVP